jgi:hypothetical protein
VIRLKVIIASLFVVGATTLLTPQSLAYPPFLKVAQKFGAKDCKFCHVKTDAPHQYNERGKWLVAERERRNATAVDPEWLVDYKPAGKGKE